MSEENNGAPEGAAEDTDHALTADQTANLADQTGDDAAAAAEGDEGSQPKPKKTAQERIDELTRARREAERDRDFYREQALRAQQPQAQPAREAEQNTDEGNAKPDPSQYENGVYDPQFIEDLTDWKADQAAARRIAERDAKEAGTAALRSFHEKAKAFQATATDFYEVVGDNLEKAATVLTEPMQLAISESAEAPALAYHLAKNPAEARRIAALTPFAQAAEIGRLEARLSAPPKASPKNATEAPEPPPQARGSGGRFTVDPATDDFAAFEKQYPG